jgi:hypothetical protein
MKPIEQIDQHQKQDKSLKNRIRTGGESGEKRVLGDCGFSLALKYKNSVSFKNFKGGGTEINENCRRTVIKLTKRQRTF